MKPRVLSLFLLLWASAVWGQSSASPVGTVTVQVTPHPANTFIPSQALGVGVDGLRQGDIARVYTPHNLHAMRSAGFGPLTYRLRTELGIEAWHWNPAGGWSEPGKAQGYWTSQAQPYTPIAQCYGYRLPRRGSTIDQANNDGFSRLDDGDVGTFWKSNPYLDRRYTGEDDAKHPQWVLINLGRKRPLEAIRIAWATPYATRYQVQYWQGESHSPDAQSLDDTFGGGKWQTFPSGTVTSARGGDVLLRLSVKPISARFIRIWMTSSSGTAPFGSRDVRDSLGYAIREISVGTLGAQGELRDWVRHTKDGKRQTPIFASSTDPWHRAQDRDPRVEQPGFDRIFASGLTNGLPLLTPAGVLYDTPDNAVAEIKYLKAQGYSVTQVELGEEPDGQYVSPEDYGALYVQWADALHRIDPALKLGGPSFQTAVDGWLAWPDSRGNQSWLNRFLGYLKARGHLNDFSFFSFEWYPFDNVCSPAAPQLALEPGMLQNALARLQSEGLSRRIPWLITEYGYSAFAGQTEMEMPGALLNAEIAAQFLTLGGSGTYAYGCEPSVPIHEVEECDTWGNLALWLADEESQARRPLPTYYAAQMLTEQWVQPGTNGPHKVYRAASDVRSRPGLPLVTAYPLLRPDGQWSVLLINKDPKKAHAVNVRFQTDGAFSSFIGPVDLYQYSPAQYAWHPNKAHGYPDPDMPPVHRQTPPGPVILPPFSLCVVRGRSLP